MRDRGTRCSRSRLAEIREEKGVFAKRSYRRVVQFWRAVCRNGSSSPPSRSGRPARVPDRGSHVRPIPDLALSANLPGSIARVDSLASVLRSSSGPRRRNDGHTEIASHHQRLCRVGRRAGAVAAPRLGRPHRRLRARRKRDRRSERGWRRLEYPRRGKVRRPSVRRRRFRQQDDLHGRRFQRRDRHLVMELERRRGRAARQGQHHQRVRARLHRERRPDPLLRRRPLRERRRRAARILVFSEQRHGERERVVRWDPCRRRHPGSRESDQRWSDRHHSGPRMGGHWRRPEGRDVAPSPDGERCEVRIQHGREGLRHFERFSDRRAVGVHAKVGAVGNVPPVQLLRGRHQHHSASRHATLLRVLHVGNPIVAVGDRHAQGLHGRRVPRVRHQHRESL